MTRAVPQHAVAEAPFACGRPPGVPDLRGRRVLVVASCPTQRLVEAMLAPSGALVTGVATGRDAVLAERRAPSDLVLMGIRLPDMHGLEAARLIRASMGAMPILAMTCCGPEEFPYASLGLNAHLPKPLSVDSVYSALRRHVGGSPAG